ncbi:unnamed protein product [Cuscuta epithymum]|uniref:Uncharacterized protein n=1 Tax=Cuscuta epithymum TaxID=186058 RepID=A0AAV0DF59_9ASTE|nr:unnamed protein product [Cuscuta epithymum]
MSSAAGSTINALHSSAEFTSSSMAVSTTASISSTTAPASATFTDAAVVITSAPVNMLEPQQVISSQTGSVVPTASSSLVPDVPDICRVPLIMVYGFSLHLRRPALWHIQTQIGPAVPIPLGPPPATQYFLGPILYLGSQRSSLLFPNPLQKQSIEPSPTRCRTQYTFGPFYLSLVFQSQHRYVCFVTTSLLPT